MLNLNGMLIIAAPVVATVLAASWALRGGNLVVFSLLAFATSTVGYFELLVLRIGVQRVFNGASLEAFGVLIVFAQSCALAAVTTAALAWGVSRWATARRSAAGARV